MIFLTELKAIDPSDGNLKDWCGPNVEAISFADAESKITDKGYLKITGILTQEIPCNPDTLKPNWNNAIDYDNDN